MSEDDNRQLAFGSWRASEAVGKTNLTEDQHGSVLILNYPLTKLPNYQIPDDLMHR